MNTALLSRTVIGAAVVMMTTSAFAQDAGFMTQEGADMWRASKLPGVEIYGPDNKKVGSITDVLIDHAGKATAIVIGVGGFLGLGQKDVALPFDQVQFADKPMMQQASPAPSGAAGTSAPAPGLGSPATNPAPPMQNGSGMTAPTNPTPNTATMSAPPPSTTYPDHGTIALTADQLKSAPSFAFAK